MRKYIVLFLMCFVLSGCSVLKSVVAPLTPVKNTIPQSIKKSKAKFKCSGKIDYYEDGTIKSCSKGYYAYDESYNKQERKLNWREKMAQFITRSSGYLIIGIILLLVLCPSLIGMVLGRLIEGTVGVTGKALKATVSAISKAKRNGQNYTEALAKEHSKDKAVQKKINELRAEV